MYAPQHSATFHMYIFATFHAYILWWNRHITYLLPSHWVTSNQAQDHCSSGTRWAESKHADGSNGIGCHATVFNAQVDGLVTGNVDEISRLSEIHSCSWILNDAILHQESNELISKGLRQRHAKLLHARPQPWELSLETCSFYGRYRPRDVPPGHIWLKVGRSVLPWAKSVWNLGRKNKTQSKSVCILLYSFIGFLKEPQGSISDIPACIIHTLFYCSHFNIFLTFYFRIFFWTSQFENTESISTKLFKCINNIICTSLMT